MRLSDQQMVNFIGWLKQNWGTSYKCICGSDNWIISDIIFELREHQPVDPSTENYQPVASVICKKCGRTIYVNAIIAGILPQKGGTQ